MVKNNPVPVVPLALKGLWGSFFSRHNGRSMSQWFPRGLFMRIELLAGALIPAQQVTLDRLESAVEELLGKPEVQH